jgi:hypothetical protein
VSLRFMIFTYLKCQFHLDTFHYLIVPCVFFDVGETCRQCSGVSCQSAEFVCMSFLVVYSEGGLGSKW